MKSLEIAKIFKVPSFLPKLIKVWKTKSLKEFSLLMYFIMHSGVTFCSIYWLFD